MSSLHHRLHHLHTPSALLKYLQHQGVTDQKSDDRLCLSYTRTEWVINSSLIPGTGFGFLIVIWSSCNLGAGGCFDGVNRGGGGSMVLDDGGDTSLEGGGWMVFGGGGGIMERGEGSDCTPFDLGSTIFFGATSPAIANSGCCKTNDRNITLPFYNVR